MARRRPRRRILGSAKWDLHYGPGGITDAGESQWGNDNEKIRQPGFRDDDDARWAFGVRQPEVGEDDWAYWRFVRELGPREAFSAAWAVRKRRRAAWNRGLAAKIAMPD